MVYAALPKERVAKKITAIVIREKLPACANILCLSLFLYQWKGKVASSREFVLLLKN